jgi:Ketopantoate hydroxymethyltransferase
MLTSYDTLTAGIFEQAGVRALLVGDTSAEMVLGYPDKLCVTARHDGLWPSRSEAQVFMLEAERLALHHEGAKQHGFRDRHHRDGIPPYA